ncbi:M10 family metallopeptidase C-terminal domain-containing protein [Caulobacter soli]|uniref:M10 family metallopeptidase C-terminal domain-containing protein n=1 Tax=Caulobacter soli TaxID=2708539 RepID=UPI0013EBC7AF|nr:M10 family metallopeptidase C-terminal domain-containing protein [Caulobacter soli]
MPFSGQLWYITEGGDADTRLARINDDNTGGTVVVDNGVAGTGDDKFASSFTADIGVDTAAGFYFAINNNTINDHAVLLRGSIGSSAAPTAVVTFSTSLIVNTIEVDAFTHRIYVGVQDGAGTNGAITGIKVYSYDTAGTLTDLGFLTTADSDNRANVNGTLHLLDPQDFALDRSVVAGGRLFYSERLGSSSNALYRLDLTSPDTATNMIAASVFPTDGSNGRIIDVEVDESNHKVYFTTRSNAASPSGSYDANDNAVWWIDASATDGTPTKVTFSGMPANVFFGGDMTFDQSTRQLYVESEETTGSDTDDVIYVLQLNAAGTTATYIRSIFPSPAFTASGANIEGLTFTDLPVLTVSGNSTGATEQGATLTALTGAPTITDTDSGYLVSATVQITGGTFSSNENSTADDHLGYSGSKQITGTIAGTSITISWNAATETLTLTGYDTIANYQTAMAGLVYWATGDNPTNYGSNTSRTVTWTVSDGSPGVLAGSVNTTTSTINIAAVNDAPVNGTVSGATGNENADIAVTGLQISDADANPASATMTVTLSVTKGVLTLRTDVGSGLTAGAVSGNGTGTVTLTGTINAINATLAASNGLLFHGNTNVSGTDTLTVVTSDGGSTGSGGTLSDTDNYTITIIGVNDAPTVSGDGTESVTASNEDISPTTLANTVSAVFGGQYADGDGDAFAGVAVIANGSTAGTGQWQYWNGSTWVNIGATSTAAAVELAASTAIRFAPATDFNGPAPTLTVRLVDASSGAITTGAVVNTTTNGGSTAFSTGTVVLSHAVTAVNDAPTVINGSTVSLTSVAEDSAPGAGQTVSSLFASHFSDAKDTVSGGSSANAFTGIAVTGDAATAAQGVYQYFEGGTWHDLPAVSTSSAFILDASTLVRFVPAADYNGTAPSLTVSLIDDAAGAVTTGATADLTTTGGTTPYSASMTLNVVVTATNDAPVASGSATLTAVAEDAANPAGATVSSLFASHFSDIDGDSLGGVAITGNAATSQGTWQYSTDSGSNWSAVGSPALSAALVLPANALIRFLPAANYNGAVPALTAHLIDNSSAVSFSASTDISANGGATHYSGGAVDLTTSITAVNDAPVVPATATTVNGVEQAFSALLGGLTVSDLELDARNGGLGDYAGATFTVQRASPNASDLFGVLASGLFTVDAGTGDFQAGGLTFATSNQTGNVLTITFNSSGTAATTALVNDLIRHIAYENTSDAPPASVTLNYSLNDGGGQGTGGALSDSGSVIFNIAGSNDAPTGGASITGTAAEDQVLTAVSTLADPDGLGTLHYQWQRDVGGGYVNVGADQSTYTLGDGDIGGLIQVKIYYTDAGGTYEEAISTPTVAIVASNDTPTGVVSVTGTAAEDQVLTADTSTLADSDGLGTLHYDWQRDTGSGFVSIGAADQATYTLDDADVGATIQVVVRYTDGQGFSNTVTSGPSAAIAGVDDPHTGGASITGTATEDQVLTAVSTLADVDGLGTLHYDWQRDTGSGFVSTGAADQATYTLGDADVGATIQVVISYTDGQGFSETATSAATATITNVNDLPTGGISITGTTTEDQVLTANTSNLVDPDGLGTFHYQWTRGVGTDTVLVGSDQPTYTLTDADVGELIGVIVTYTDQRGAAEQVSIVGTNPIAPVNDLHTGGASITGTPTENQVLTAVSTLADVDGLGTLHYDWQRDTGSGFVSIGAADQATYTLGDADVGATVQVVISYTDGQGFSEAETSTATAAIANVNDLPTGVVTITGTKAENQVLTANTSALADADGLGTLHYDWQRDTGSGFVSIGAADQATYTLGDADVGATIQVVISYTDGHATSETVTSSATTAISAVNDVHTGGASITGTATEDQVLTAVSTLADVDGLGTLHYDWQRDTGSGFVSIGAADQATYTLGDADVGATIQVVISYTDGQGFSETATSAATATIANVNDLPTGGVSVTGTAAENLTLTADTSTLVDLDGLGTLHYQWQRDSGSGFVNVGADQATYALTATDVGAVVRVVTSYTDDHGTAESATSAATATVAHINLAPTGVNDANAVTQRLSVSGSVRTNDSDADDTLTTLTVTNVAFNTTHVDQAVVAGGTVVNGANGKLTIRPDGTYTYVADHEGLVVGQVVTDKFDYTIKDPGGAAGTAQLTITITGSATGDANANTLISDGTGHTLTGKGGADTLTGAGGADVFAYEAVSDSTIANFDTITDFTHGVDTLRLTPLMTGSTKLTLTTDGTNKILSIDQNGDGTADGQIKSLGQGLQVKDIVTGVAHFGFTINGSAGADSLHGGNGGDILTGGAGADTFYYDDGDSPILHWDVITDFQTGQDKLNISAADDGIVILARFGLSTFIYFGGLGNSSVVQVFGDIKLSDLITSNGVSFSMYGDDSASSGGGDNNAALAGGSGDDVLVGRTTDSTLFGGDGADIMYGGDAHDTFQYTSVTNSNFSAYDSVIDFTPDEDKIDISAIDGGKITIARFAGTTFIYSAPDAGGNFQSVITVQGTSLKASDVIGSGGATQAFTMVGDSTSHNIADTLIAGAGNDILYGLDGNDTLTGGGGADFMIGGAGADTFVYTAATDSRPVATDLIFDFSHADGDRLDLSGIDANSGTGANDAFSVVTSFSQTAGQLIIAAPDSSGYYHVSGDLNGDGIADFVIALNVTGTLTSADILL